MAYDKPMATSPEQRNDSTPTPVAHLPRGFVGLTACLGLKADTDDFAVVASTGGSGTTSAAVFTQSRFAGASVELSRGSDRSGLRAIVALSKNANVATGAQGMADAIEVRRRVASLARCRPEELLIASTGVIGVRYPMDTLSAALDATSPPVSPPDFVAVATAIMTTDTHPKLVTTRVGDATIAAVAKGVGMIEPDMATLLTFFFTDAAVPAADLEAIFTRVVARSFNALSIDTDTSTSDTAAIIASGAAGAADLEDFERALAETAVKLVKMIASDGEGASKLIEVRVSGARDDAQAKLVAKAIVNSPLVKTAVHGADPNWGRIAMAIGKCADETDIFPERVRIGFGDLQVYPEKADVAVSQVRQELERYLHSAEVVITVDLGVAEGSFTVYGCDLSEGYIRINADYTT